MAGYPVQLLLQSKSKQRKAKLGCGIVKTTTQPQLNQTKPNNQQINESWVLHENDFAHHPPHPPTHQKSIFRLRAIQANLGHSRST